VLGGVPEREELVGGRQAEVERENGKLGADPVKGSYDTGSRVAAAFMRLLGDQREQPLGVGLPLAEVEVVAESSFQPVEVADTALMREQAS